MSIYCWCFCTSVAFHIRIRKDCSEQVCDSCWIRHGDARRDMKRKQENTRVRRWGSAPTTPTTTTTSTFFLGGAKQQELFPYKKGKAQLCKQEASAPLPIPGNNNNSNFFGGGRITTTSAPEGKRITLQATSHNLNLKLGGKQQQQQLQDFFGGAEQQLHLYKKEKKHNFASKKPPCPHQPLTITTTSTFICGSKGGQNHNTLTEPLFPFLICLCWRRAVV